jgi:hypothetical protein
MSEDPFAVLDDRIDAVAAAMFDHYYRNIVRLRNQEVDHRYWREFARVAVDTWRLHDKVWRIYDEDQKEK